MIPRELDLKVPYLAAALGYLDANQLSEIFQQAATRAEFQYLLWQTTKQHDWSHFSAEANPADYLEAQAFGRRGELHWKEQFWRSEGGLKSGWRVVWIGEKAACPEGLLTEHACQIRLFAPDWQCQEITVLLWGERRPGQSAWIEPRIPRLLNYPLAATERVGLKLLKHNAPAQPAFWQLYDLVPWKEG